MSNKSPQTKIFTFLLQSIILNRHTFALEKQNRITGNEKKVINNDY